MQYYSRRTNHLSKTLSFSPAKLVQSRYSASKESASDKTSHRFITIYTSIQNEIQYLTKQKSLIQQNLKIYESLLQSKIPQKCLLHNNSISLYCTKDKKVLCVNCMYANNQHRTHKVLPIKEATVEIQKDNIILYGNVTESLNWMQANQRISKQNCDKLTKSLDQMTLSIQKQFDNILKDMSNKYLQLKNSVQFQYKRAIEENQQIYNETKNIKSIIDKCLYKIDNYKGSEDVEIVKHLLIDSVTNNIKSLFKKPLERVNLDTFESITMGELEKLKLYISKHRWSKVGRNE